VLLPDRFTNRTIRGFQGKVSKNKGLAFLR